MVFTPIYFRPQPIPQSALILSLCTRRKGTSARFVIKIVTAQRIASDIKSMTTKRYYTPLTSLQKRSSPRVLLKK